MDTRFEFAHFSIDRWMKVVPGGYLQGTDYGRDPDREIPAVIAQEGMLRQVYLMDLALFISAERVAAKVAGGLTRLADDEATLLFLASQTVDEARHFEAFAQRFKDLGMPIEVREKLARDFMTPAYKEFLDLLLEAVDAGDLESGLIGLNVILEGMAFPLYDYEMRYWRPFDTALVQIIEGAFKDECRHVGFGEKKLAHRLKGDVEARNRVQRRVGALAARMQGVFDEFLEGFVAFYDIAVQAHPERCAEVEIIPGRRLLDTPAEEQVRWLQHQIQKGHEKRLRRLGLECAS